MRKWDGFTIVEVTLTIAIMAILLTVVVAGLASTQVSGRDEDRKSDTDIIARSLETFYVSGEEGTATPKGRYPGTTPLQAQLGSSARFPLLANIDATALKAPDNDTISLVMATNASQTVTGIRPLPTIDTYVYQPLAYNAGPSTYTLCTDHTTTECRKFNLFYRLEKDNSVQKITSKNQ